MRESIPIILNIINLNVQWEALLATLPWYNFLWMLKLRGKMLKLLG